jgi:hypothetical protein
MNYKDSLQDSLIRYPQTNHNRIAVFMSWFCSTCSVWRRGELVERGSRIRKPMTKEEGYLLQLTETIRKVKREDPLYKILHVTNDVMQIAIKNVLKAGWEAEQPLVLAPEQNVRWISDDCALLNIPRNITADWLEAVNEMKVWLKENYDLYEASDKKIIDKILTNS